MSRWSIGWLCISATIVVSTTGVAVSAAAPSPSAGQGDGVTASVPLPVTRGAVRPMSLADVGLSTVPDTVRMAAAEGVRAKREATDKAVTDAAGPAAPRAGGGVRPAGPQTRVSQGASDALSIVRNNRNTRAEAVSSTLAEPAAANDGNLVFYSGNTYNSYSPNKGATWGNRVIHAGPAEASVPCCDADVVHHAPTDTTFATLLYTNAAQTNGVVDIEVRRGSPSTVDCIYRIDPGGTADNVLPDYPHIAVTSQFLFLSTNNNGPSGWTGANTRRFDVAQLSACGTAAFTSYNYVGTVGQRVHVPGETQQGVGCEYWAQYENTTTVRWFQWCDFNSAPTDFTRVTPTTNFANPDCRGGTGNFDFIERSTAWSITGFRGRATVGGTQVAYLINASSDATHTQAHLRGQAISRSTLGVVQDLFVFNNGLCFGFPALGSNSRNDLGLSMAVGGRSGGGGTAAEGYVGVDDADSAGIFFSTVSETASGTHNRSDSRFGDYFTVRGNDQCPGAWSATNYSLLNGNTLPSNVNARYIEFQSTNQAACP